jgi:hypothetical protein
MRHVAVFVTGVLALCSCSTTQKPSSAVAPSAHLIASGGKPVAGAPEPEVVQLEKIEEIDSTKHVSVGNSGGTYVLVCNLAADKDNAAKSCLSPLPQQDYLLFRENTKWLFDGAKEPMTLQLMQDFAVSYNNAENVGLQAASPKVSPGFGVYWLLSWTAKSQGHSE